LLEVFDDGGIIMVVQELKVYWLAKSSFRKTLVH